MGDSCISVVAYTHLIVTLGKGHYNFEEGLIVLS